VAPPVRVRRAGSPRPGEGKRAGPGAREGLGRANYPGPRGWLQPPGTDVWEMGKGGGEAKGRASGEEITGCEPNRLGAGRESRVGVNAETGRW
jgi:hypothetical protein